MITSRNDEALVDAVVHYGQQPQEDICIGELGELLTLFGRRTQGRDSREEWIDEIADATLTLRTLALIHCGDGLAVDRAVDAKAGRLSIRVAADSARQQPVPSHDFSA